MTYIERIEQLEIAVLELSGELKQANDKIKILTAFNTKVDKFMNRGIDE